MIDQMHACCQHRVTTLVNVKLNYSQKTKVSKTNSNKKPTNSFFPGEKQISVMKFGYGHEDTTKLKNIRYGTRHVYTYYFQTFN